MGKTERKNKAYSAEFKIGVIMNMREHHLGYRETILKYWNDGREANHLSQIRLWERIYLEEGAEGLMKERRGSACSSGGTKKVRPAKLDKKVEEDLIAENQRLRMEIEYFKKTECLSSCARAKERQKAKIISELRQNYPLKELLKLSGLARGTYYYYLKQPNTDKYECEKQEIYNANKGRYGYLRITIAMRNKGYVINHKTVQKLMNILGLKGKQRKNDKYHSYKGTVGKVADNLLKRDFYASKNAFYPFIFLG